MSHSKAFSLLKSGCRELREVTEALRQVMESQRSSGWFQGCMS